LLFHLELAHGFEFVIANQSNVILAAKTLDEKNNWMAALVSLHIRSNLERMLDSALKDEEKQHPLKPLDQSDYRLVKELLHSRNNPSLPCSN
jgi:son of sevenless-like protein